MIVAAPDPVKATSRTTSPMQRGPSTHEPLEVAVVGTGFIADYHMQILRALPGIAVTAACDAHPGRLQKFCSKWEIARQAATVEELLTQHKPHVAHVLLPPSVHYSAGLLLLKAGVHVLMEKPIALNLADAEELIQVARDKDRLLGVNHNWVHQPFFIRARRDIEDKQIGPIKHVISTNTLPLFQLQAGLHDHWMFESPFNILFEQAVHPLSQLCQLIGPANDVNATCGDPIILRTGKRFYRDWQLIARGSSATAQLFLSFGESFPDSQLHIIGQDGVIRIDQLNNLYTIDQRTRFVEPGDRFVRGLRQAGSMARDATKGLLAYLASLLRIAGRQDVYYLGMLRSIQQYYAQLRELAPESATNGWQTINVLHRAINAIEERPTKPAAVKKSRSIRETSVDTRIKKVLVIGASGFIGRKVVERFATAGVPQRLFVRSAKRLAELAEFPQSEVFEGDVNDRLQVAEATDGCDIIIHLVAGAPNDWAGFQKLFIDGLLNVAQAASATRAKRLIFASSIAALYLGKPSEIISNETLIDSHLNRRCHYARAKILCEQLLGDLRRQTGLRAVVMRPGIVIGPGSRVQHLGVGEWPSDTICVRWGLDIDHGLPFVLVDDVADAFYKAAVADDAAVVGRSFNLVGPVKLSAREYLQALSDLSGRRFTLNRSSVIGWSSLELAKWSIKSIARKPENQRMTWREIAYRTGAATFDCSDTEERLGWRPESDRAAFIERGIAAALRGYST